MTEYICNFCGKKFQVSPSRRINQHKYCSKHCYYEAIHEHIKEDSCRQISQKIAKQNFPWKCSLCNSTKYLNVHHKDGNPCNYSIENLQIVCRKHHLELHGNPMQGRKHSEEAKRKMSIIHKNRHPSKETRLKMSLTRKGSKNPNFGKKHPNLFGSRENNPFYGHKHSEKSRQKMSQSQKRRFSYETRT